MANAKPVILALDPDPAVRDELGDFLAGKGCVMHHADSGRECLDFLKANEDRVDAILMDISVPDIDGLALISQIRDLTFAPIILMSEKAENSTKVVALDLGADDYIEKPFDPLEVFARMKAVIRRYEGASPVIDSQRFTGAHAAKPNDAGAEDKSARLVYKFEGRVLDPEAMTLKDEDGTLVELTSHEIELLTVLVEAHGRVLTRENLFEKVKHEDYESFDRAIDVQISRLRKKLGDDPKSAKLIQTVHGAGYKFGSDVEQVEQNA